VSPTQHTKKEKKNSNSSSALENGTVVRLAVVCGAVISHHIAQHA
jgi:hypothetical protein